MKMILVESLRVCKIVAKVVSSEAYDLRNRELDESGENMYTNTHGRSLFELVKGVVE